MKRLYSDNKYLRDFKAAPGAAIQLRPKKSSRENERRNQGGHVVD